MVIIRSDRLKDMQKSDRVIQLHVGSPYEAASVKVVALHNKRQCAFQFKHRPLHQQLRSLVHNLKSEFIRMQEIGGVLLQGEERICSQVSFVVGGTFAGQNWLA